MQVIEEKTFSITEFRRHTRRIWEYIGVTGRAAVITRYGERAFVMMSVETYARISSDYEKTMVEIKNAAGRFHTGKVNEKGTGL